MPEGKISTEELEKILMDPSTPKEEFSRALLRIKAIQEVQK